MNEDKKQLIYEKIREYDSIVLSRHFRPDGDAVGSSLGLKRILELTFPEKKIYLSNNDRSEYMAFLGDEGEKPSDEVIKKSLVIVLDTATSERISDPRVMGGKEVIKIDHHIEVSKYGDISWVEDWRSSVCEMVASFYEAFSSSLVIDKDAATMIYAGMNTDSGRFRFSSTSSETLRLAGVLVGKGVDVERLQANLDLRGYDYYRFQADVFSRIKMTEHGVAWLFVDKEMQRKWNLTREDAGESVGFMSAIKGSICWIAFIENDNGEIRVRLRSRFMTVNQIAQKYHGGGHDRASGATVYSMLEMEKLLNDADEETRKFKESGEYWV